MSEFYRESEPPAWPIDKIADLAGRLRREKKLSIREAVARALVQFDVPKDERDDIGGLVSKELGRRGGEVAKKRKKNKKEQPMREVYAHWREEARRAGFDDVDDYLDHLSK